MELAFNIAQCVAWAPGLESQQDWELWQSGKKDISNELGLPQLKAIPPMQRRRLSPFAKVTLHCALEASNHFQGDLPCVFSSRHGDLHRTSELIEDVVEGNDLSPTRFGLSVHNAVSGLYSIYTKNHAPISAVSFGDASFLSGLVDAVVKLHAHNLSEILYVYSDLKVPECYAEYVAQDISIGTGILIKAVSKNDHQFSLECLPNDAIQSHGCQALEFMHFFLGKNSSWESKINQQTWKMKRN